MAAGWVFVFWSAADHPDLPQMFFLTLALFGLQMLPVNYTGLGLLLLGLLLFAAELHAPSFGALGAGGVIAFIAGGVLLFDRAQPGYGVPLWLILRLTGARR